MSAGRGRRFTVGVAITASEVIVTVDGEVDLLTAPEMGAVVNSMIDRGHRSLVLDLAGCGFMDASGLTVIAGVVTRLGSGGGTLTIRDASRLTVRILGITGLDTMVVIEGSEPVPGHLGTEQATVGPQVVLPAGGARTGAQAADLRQLHAFPAGRDVLDAALHLVVVLARAAVAGADGVSISLRRDGRLATVAASDQVVSDMDACQYTTGEGPCVDASVEGRWFHAEDLDTETRWPEFTPRAQRLGINAILSSPLIAREQPVGALNIYSRTPVGFDRTGQQLAATLAGEASQILEGSGFDVSDEELVRRLHHAQRARQTIALAQGAIMERDGVDADSAYVQLLGFSQRTNRPLLEWAREVVAATSRSPLAPPAS